MISLSQPLLSLQQLELPQQKPLPPDLIEDVQIKQKQVAVLETELVQKKAHAEAIRARFESDRQRYRELKPRTAVAVTN